MQQGGNRNTEKLLLERSVPGRVGVVMPGLDVPAQPLPDDALLRNELARLRYRSLRWSNTSPASAS